MSLDERLVSEVHAASQRFGLSDDEVIEQALWRFVGLEVFDEPKVALSCLYPITNQAIARETVIGSVR